jgi:hypothetical protein
MDGLMSPGRIKWSQTSDGKKRKSGDTPNGMKLGEENLTVGASRKVTVGAARKNERGGMTSVLS